MAVNIFGLSYTDVSQSVQNLTINAGSSPTSTWVDQIINFSAAEFAREASYVGIDVDGLTAGDADYILCKQAILYKSIAETLIARERGNTAAGEYYISRYDRLIDILRKRPSTISSGGDGPDRTFFISESDTTELGLQFYQSPAGAVALNGV